MAGSDVAAAAVAEGLEVDTGTAITRGLTAGTRPDVCGKIWFDF